MTAEVARLAMRRRRNGAPIANRPRVVFHQVEIPPALTTPATPAKVPSSSGPTPSKGAAPEAPEEVTVRGVRREIGETRYRPWLDAQRQVIQRRALSPRHPLSYASEVAGQPRHSLVDGIRRDGGVPANQRLTQPGAGHPRADAPLTATSSCP